MVVPSDLPRFPTPERGDQASLSVSAAFAKGAGSGQTTDGFGGRAQSPGPRVAVASGLLISSVS